MLGGYFYDRDQIAIDVGARLSSYLLYLTLVTFSSSKKANVTKHSRLFRLLPLMCVHDPRKQQREYWATWHCYTLFDGSQNTIICVKKKRKEFRSRTVRRVEVILTSEKIGNINDFASI